MFLLPGLYRTIVYADSLLNILDINTYAIPSFIYRFVNGDLSDVLRVAL